MIRLVRNILITACALMLAGAALAPAKEATPKPAKAGEDYHHLLMLDLKDAEQHAKALNDYSKKYAAKLDKQVVMKHVDELEKNLDAANTDQGKLEAEMGAEKVEHEANLTMITQQEKLARGDLDALKAELNAQSPDPTLIEQKSKSIYQAMVTANEHHKTVMNKRGVKEPATPSKK